MPEAAVLEKDTTSSTTTEKDVFEAWRPLLEKAGTDSNLRDAIFRKIREQKKPVGGVDNVSLDDLRQMSDEEREKKFAEIRKKPIVEKPEDLKQIDDMLDSYLDQVKGAEGLLGDESVAPGERLVDVKEKDGWVKYGWSDQDKDEVRRNLTRAFGGFLELTDDQKKIMMEILLSIGKKPSDLSEKALGDAREKAKAEWDASSPDVHRDYKHTFEIFFMKELGINFEYIRHFILNDKTYYNDENDHEIYYGSPKSIEDLAWQIMQTPGKGYKGWGIKGDTPLLDMWIATDKDGKIDTSKSMYRVNTSNMTRWARYNMYTAYDLDREDPHDFFKSIALKSRYPISLQEMLLNPDQYFVSRDGETNYKQLMLQWYKEAAIFGTLRSWDVAYREVIGESDELMKVFRQMFNTKNLMSRGALGANLLQLMSTLPLNFEGMKGGQWPSDSIMGTSIIDIYRAYDAISDFRTLKEIFGEGSKLFTRAGIDEAIKEVAKDKIVATGANDSSIFLSIEEQQYYKKAFDSKGEISSEENEINFIKLMNVFNPKQPSAAIEFVVRAALRNAVAEKYGQEVIIEKANGEPLKDKRGNYVTKHALIVAKPGDANEDIKNRVEDAETLQIAEAIAWSMARPFGAHAKNDIDGVDHDEMSKRYNTYKTRMKYPGKGDKLGNPLTVSAFKRMTVDPFNALVTQAPVWLYDENGKPLLDEKGNRKFRYKTILEVFRELSEYQTLGHKRLKDLEQKLADAHTDEEKQDLRKAIGKHVKEMNQGYQDNTSKLSLKQRLLSNYYEDHLRHSNEIYKQTMANQEMEWEKYTSYDALGGVRFKGAEFQEDFQDKWLHKIRYMFLNYGDLNFNMKVRVLNQEATAHKGLRKGEKGEPVYHDVYLGEALFGHEILNRKEFWKLDDRGRPIHLRDHRGRKMRGKYEIDYDKVQNNKLQVWKSWLLTKIAADFYSHRALHENEPRFNFTYYQQAIGAIARLPGDLIQNEFDFKGTEAHGTFFSKDDIAWLKRKARVENFDLYWRAFFKDIFKDDKPEEGIGLLLALSLATKAILEFKN